MAVATPCAVPECPALATNGGRCPVHQKSILAAHLALAIGRPCEVCRRAIQRDDWVDMRTTLETIGGVLIQRFRHVGCRPPKATAKSLRKVIPPLPFDDNNAP